MIQLFEYIVFLMLYDPEILLLWMVFPIMPIGLFFLLSFLFWFLISFLRILSRPISAYMANEGSRPPLGKLKFSVLFLLCIQGFLSKERSNVIFFLAPLGVLVRSRSGVVFYNKFGKKLFGSHLREFVGFHC